MRSGSQLSRWLPQDPTQRLFAGLMGLLLAGGAGALLLASPLPLLPVTAGLGLLLLFTDWRLLYFLFFLTLPFSREIGIAGGLSLDVPSEPLMLVLTGCMGASLLMRRHQLPARELRHPLLILLLLTLFWAGLSTLFSVDTTKSIKFPAGQRLVPDTLRAGHAAAAAPPRPICGEWPHSTRLGPA